MCLIAICLQSLFRSHLNSTAHIGISVHAKQHRTILRPHSGPLNTDVHPLLSGPPLQISLGAHAGPYPSALSRAQASGRHQAQPQGGGKQHGDSTARPVPSIHTAAGTPRRHLPGHTDGDSQPTLRIPPDIWKWQCCLSIFSFPG